jgi:hypothetical protein
MCNKKGACRIRRILTTRIKFGLKILTTATQHVGKVFKSYSTCNQLVVLRKTSDADVGVDPDDDDDDDEDVMETCLRMAGMS